MSLQHIIGIKYQRVIKEISYMIVICFRKANERNKSLFMNSIKRKYNSFTDQMPKVEEIKNFLLQFLIINNSIA